MECVVREMKAADGAIWAGLRCLLWPEETAADHVQWIDGIL
jgi:hypothetical protein